MKNPRKNEPPLLNPPDAGLKLRFAEKENGFLVFFRHEVPILVRQPPDQTVGPLCTVGFRGEIPLGLSSSTAC